MHRLRLSRWWKNLSIAKKLYFVFGVMAVLIAGELGTLRFAMRTLSAVRAFVGGEGLWSKGQKDALYHLQRYMQSGEEMEFAAFNESLEIPEGDHRARMALMSSPPSIEGARSGFLAGQVHPDDIDPMIELLRRFNRVSYLARAIEIWGLADEKLAELRAGAERYRLALRTGAPPHKLHAISERIGEINRELSPLENEFSAVLGAGSRWLESVVISLLFLAVLTVESIGLTLTFLTSREITRGLGGLNQVAHRIGEGEFGVTLPVRSNDEIGRLTGSVNAMSLLLEKSYRELSSSHADLERRIRERTAESERIASENARLYEEAQDAVRTRDEFLSIASHELRTPLAGLHLQLELLERLLKAGPIDPRRAAGLADTSLRLSRRLSGLLDELMDLTRIRVGKLEIRRQRCDLSGIVCDVASQLSAEAAKAGSAVEIRSEGPVYGQFDPVKIGQVVSNLVSNAIKYGQGQPIDIVAEADEASARIIVRDRGPGVPIEKQPMIFERYERANADESVQGLGLGLYISKQIMEAHGGTLRVDSVPGQGAAFIAELRLA
jgi:signal transduction histidine kinase